MTREKNRGRDGDSGIGINLFVLQTGHWLQGIVEKLWTEDEISLFAFIMSSCVIVIINSSKREFGYIRFLE